jgi:hypothetical protein
MIGLLMMLGVIGAGSYARAQDLDSAAMAEIEQILAASFEESFKTGAKLEGWNRDGADLIAAIDAAPGGRAGNVFVSIGPDGERSVSFHDVRMDDIAVPADWAKIAESPRTDLGAAPVVEVATLDGPIMLVIEYGLLRNGTALCSRGLGNYRLYRAPNGKTAEMPETMALVMLQVMARKLHDRMVCDIFEPVPGGYRARSVSGEGETYPRLDAKEPDIVRIVPKAALAELLSG